MQTIKKSGRVVAVLIALASAVSLFSLPAPAAGATVPNGLQQCVSSETVRVRPTDANPNYIGVLSRGETFDMVTLSSSGSPYVYGFAYGSVNQWGWVDITSLSNC